MSARRHTRRAVFIVAVVAGLALPASAAAHVVLTPAQVAPETLTLFTVLSPNENEQPLTGMRLAIPEGLEIDSVADSAGFTANVVTDQQHRIVALNWQGGPVPPDRLALFQFSGVANATGTLQLTGVQRFADGSTRTWNTATLTVAAESSRRDTLTLVLAVAALVLAVLLAVAVGFLFARSRRAVG